MLKSDSSKAKFIFIATLIVAFAGTYLYDMYSTPAIENSVKSENPDITEKAPDLNFTDISGNKISLSDFKGKIVILNFWASWCAPCIKEIPTMMRLLDKTQGKVILLALSSDTSTDKITAFLNKYNSVNNPPFKHKWLHIIWDEKHRISQDVFHTIRYPESIIINPSGNMVRKVVGGDLIWDAEETIEYFNTLQ